jgi:hypothetical protein
MITVKPNAKPTLRVEVYTPTARKPGWAQGQLARMPSFDEWRAQGRRSAEDCLEYWRMVITLKAISRGEVVYVLEDRSADWATADEDVMAEGRG